MFPLEAVSLRMFPLGAVSLRIGFAKVIRGSRETKIHNGKRVLLAVLNLYLRTKIRVATMTLIIPSPIAKQSIAASIQNFPGSVVKSVSTTRHGQSRCVRPDD